MGYAAEVGRKLISVYLPPPFFFPFLAILLALEEEYALYFGAHGKTDY